MDNYTKGEWKADRYLIASVYKDANNSQEAEANVHLITAALDMYEALKLLAAQYVLPSNKVYVLKQRIDELERAKKFLESRVEYLKGKTRRKDSD